MRTTKEITDQIVELVGGPDNIRVLVHCATRLRFQLKDTEKFDRKKLDEMDEVMGAVQSGKESQVIIGGEVSKYYTEITKNYPIEGNGEVPDDDFEDNRNLFRKALDKIVAIMAPIIIALIGGGMFRVLVSIFVVLGMDKEGLNYQILNMIGDSVFYFLPFLIAISAAKQFNTNQFLALGITGVLLHPTFTSLVSSGESLALFGAPIRSANYNGTVIPIILIIWFMSYVDKLAEKFVPNVVKTMLKPLLMFAITAPVALIILGPVGAIAGDGLFYVVELLSTHVPWLVPTLMGTFCPLLVMVGMHVSLTPLASISLTNVGYEIVQGPGMLASNIAQSGASFGTFFKTKDKKMKQIALSAGITALSGITEPALYGVTLKMKRLLPYVMISGGIAGFYAGMVGLVRYSFGSPGIFTLPVFIGDNPSNFMHAVITAGIAFGTSFLLTIIFGLGTDELAVEEEKEAEAVEKKLVGGTQTLSAVVAGEIVPLAQVEDDVFSTELMGKGIAIEPSEGEFFAPISGEVTTLFPSGHAIGITDDKGNEVLIHIGIDTVRLDGAGFELQVQQGDQVTKGQLLVKVDLDYLHEEGFKTTTMVILLNSKDRDLKVTDKTQVAVGDELVFIN